MVIAIDILLAVLVFVSVIVVHEMGHLAGGLLSGYRMEAFQIMGFLLVRTRRGLRLRIANERAWGQCIMTPGSKTANGYLLILGGCAANLAAGLICLLAVMLKTTSSGLIPVLLCGMLHLMLGISNFIPGKSGVNDGDTYREVRRGSMYMAMYNSVMLVSAVLIRDGIPDALRDVEIFYIYDSRSTLSAELSQYRRFCRCAETGGAFDV